ncbi:hypothetical protein GCM10009799_27640 [Nocardiopsis rhodophaea]|uniref:Secreted protein n=1 Tax=Nocardiopsis rhodophaea TaxID=280238 RepID=A0ABN2T5A3_9ACTN
MQFSRIFGRTVALSFLAAGTAAVMAAPAGAEAADTTLQLSCAKGVSNGVAYASCAGHSGEEWRLRADCPWQPDRYSAWQRGDGNVSVGCFAGDARAAIIEYR